MTYESQEEFEHFEGAMEQSVPQEPMQSISAENNKGLREKIEKIDVSGGGGRRLKVQILSLLKEK